MFAVAQIMYTSAFGLKPLNPYQGGIFALIGSLAYYYLYPGLEGPMVYLTFLYLSLIVFMAWRAIARVQFFDDLWTWTKLCGCAGAVCFLISDFTIAVDKFRYPVPYAHQIIMTSYYAAQFGIALSVVDSQVDALLEEANSPT